MKDLGILEYRNEWYRCWWCWGFVSGKVDEKNWRSMQDIANHVQRFLIFLESNESHCRTLNSWRHELICFTKNIYCRVWAGEKYMWGMNWRKDIYWISTVWRGCFGNLGDRWWELN
jgi:hypothetical protein